MEKLSKIEANERVEEFFKDLKNKSPEEIRKIKKMAAHYNIKLGDKRKKFCKECFSQNLRVKSVKNKAKTTECKDCGAISRWKIK